MTEVLTILSRSDAAAKQQVISAFLDRFTLSQSEVALLESPSSSSIGPQLFLVMDKIARIRHHCQLLLASTSEGEDVAELDIMKTTSAQLDKAFAKLHKFATFQVRGYTRPEVEVSPLMRQIIQHLKPRAELFQSVLDLLASNRSAALLSHFIEALTRGGPSGLPRPIELHAHDPIRYVGDMLAWIHQLMAGEREFLESLFSIKADQRLPGAVRADITISHHRTQSITEEQIADERRIRSLMDKDLEGCGRPLKLRILQTVKSQEGALMAYRISNLVLFYKQTIERTVGREALMSSVLADIAQQATESFHEILESNGRSLLRFIQPPPADLSPPHTLQEALGNLKEIMEVYAGALLDQQPDSPSSHQDAEEAFEPVLQRGLDPVLQMCDQMAETHQPNVWDRLVFTLNCRAYVKTALDAFQQFTARRSQSLQDELDQRGEQLVSDHVSSDLIRSYQFHFDIVPLQYASLLKESGLAPFVEAIEIRKEGASLSLPTLFRCND